MALPGEDLYLTALRPARLTTGCGRPENTHFSVTLATTLYVTSLLEPASAPSWPELADGTGRISVSGLLSFSNFPTARWLPIYSIGFPCAE